jgi:hypothetical protein
VSESAVSAKPLLVYGLARNRRRPKHPSEPRQSGVHPEEGVVKERREAFIILVRPLCSRAIVAANACEETVNNRLLRYLRCCQPGRG